MVRKAKKPFTVEVNRKGNLYQYFRKGKTYVRLPDDPDSPEYDAAYWDLRSGKIKASVKTTYENLIISYYKSSRFLTKAESTKKEYRRTVERIRKTRGNQDFTKLKRAQVIEARDKYAATWRKANGFVEMLSILATHAIDLEWIVANPASGVDKLTGGEYKPWPKDKRKAYLLYCNKHGLSIEILAYNLGTGTGQRIGDVIKMEWDHFDNGYMAVVQEKTGERIWVYCPQWLQDYLETVPKQGKYILAKNLTEHIGKRQIQKKVEIVRDKINAMDYVIHGWRYTAAVELAEAGCSDSEIQAVTGHKTLAMVQKYRAQANQRKLSRKAQERRE